MKELARLMNNGAPTQLCEGVSSCSIVHADSHPSGATCVQSYLFLWLYFLSEFCTAQLVCFVVLKLEFSDASYKYLFSASVGSFGDANG